MTFEMTGERVRFGSQGHRFKIGLVDDGLPADPTLLIFRDDEEEAIATIHLNPNAQCIDPGHVIAPFKEPA